MASAFYYGPATMQHAFVEPIQQQQQQTYTTAGAGVTPGFFVPPPAAQTGQRMATTMMQAGYYDYAGSANASPVQMQHQHQQHQHQQPRLKRKHSSSDDESDDHTHRTALLSPVDSRSPSPPSGTTLAPQGRRKRRRLGTIERGLEGMSLHPQHQHRRDQPPHFVGVGDMLTAAAVEPIVEEPDDDDVLTQQSYSYYGDVNDYSAAAAAAAAAAVPVREVRMRNAGWYEPEKDRIVITDLDASDDDELELESNAGSGAETLHVPPGMLSALHRSARAQTSFRLPHTAPHDHDGAALVLYRPSPWRRTPTAYVGEPEIEVLDDDDDDDDVDDYNMPSARCGSVDGDAMDVDMMDVEEL
ncbi:hypothetical protein BKA62DRAFT_673657 [Auriculariales sp. MPI-PUGE-AT-0066]|nr:hypothetical protein BKA62DRAFT_673657 [Auriculariales sp. MPI-PUGE-AT-0066]